MLKETSGLLGREEIKSMGKLFKETRAWLSCRGRHLLWGRIPGLLHQALGEGHPAGQQGLALQRDRTKPKYLVRRVSGYKILGG